MSNINLTLVKRLLEVRDICGFSAEYLVHNLHHFDTQVEQYIIYSLCSNLQRSVHNIELELIACGFHCEDRPYSHSSFENVDYLDVDLVELVKEYIQKKQDAKEKRKKNGSVLFK